MVFEIKNKTVVITGGAEGLGLEMAEQFLQKNAKLVILLDINERLAKESVKNLNSKYGNDKAVFYKCDVTTDVDTVSKEIFKKYKTVDVLINNAGILNDELVKLTIDINVMALIAFSLKFFEHMRTDLGGQGGTIINLASIYGFRVDQFLPVYQASKFAVMGFTKSLGHEYNYNKYGVRVVAICPGFTETKLVATPKAIYDKSQADMDAMLKKTPWQKPVSVGNAAVEAYQKAPSGTAWLIEGGKPIVQV